MRIMRNERQKRKGKANREHDIKIQEKKKNIKRMKEEKRIKKIQRKERE